MARAGAVYPQVEPGAAALMERRVGWCAARCRLAVARRAARRVGAELLVTPDGSVVRGRDLERASRWRLGKLRSADLAWTGLPTVTPRALETSVRRLLMRGAPMVLVREARRVVGVIDGEKAALVHPSLSVAHRLERVEDRAGEARLWLLRLAGKVGERMGASVFAVGGFVRDFLLERRAPDIDLVVEGDGLQFTRRLAEEVGGGLVVHPDFGTASVEGARAVGGVPLGRLDVAGARRERYAAPGALPTVSGGTVFEDLRRRDFSVNAMALTLTPSAFGRLLDPLGGQADLRARRLRPLHPLSFVEDPTRIFRAARYAARLGFRLDAAAVAALRVALRVGDYPALSGHRLRVELDLLAAEGRSRGAVARLLDWRALRLWDRGYRASPDTLRRLRAVDRLRAWAEQAGIALDPGEVLLVALLLDQRPRVVGRCLERLAITGEPLSALRQAAAAATLARRLDGRAFRRSEAALVLNAWPRSALIGAWLHGGGRVRRRIEWFLTEGRAVRPLVSGDDVLHLGVPRGPDVGACLSALRRLKLDGGVTTMEQEREFVKEWLRRRSIRNMGRTAGRDTGSGPEPGVAMPEPRTGGVR